MAPVVATLTTRPCRACRSPRAIRATLRDENLGRDLRLAGYCAVCLSKVIDAAYGWRTQANVLQGLAARELGDTIHLQRQREKIRAR
jgi:hypothetical protein